MSEASFQLDDVVRVDQHAHDGGWKGIVEFVLPKSIHKRYRVALANGEVHHYSHDELSLIAAESPDRAPREALADVSHEIWSSWMDWMFDQGTMAADGTWVMPEGLVVRWKRQMRTPYADLTEREKNSDREQADKILAVLKAAK